MMQSSWLWTCPHCWREDQVQKVSALVASGTTTGMEYGWTVGRAGQQRFHGNTVEWSRQQTVLATLLAPPRQPRPVAELAAVVALLLLIGFLLCVLSQAAIVVEAANLFLVTLWLVFVSLPVVLLVLLGRAMRTQTADSRRAWLEWQRRRQKWEALYYCHRCGGVFLPGIPMFVPAPAAQTFLTQP